MNDTVVVRGNFSTGNSCLASTIETPTWSLSEAVAKGNFMILQLICPVFKELGAI